MTATTLRLYREKTCVRASRRALVPAGGAVLIRGFADSESHRCAVLRAAEPSVLVSLCIGRPRRE